MIRFSIGIMVGIYIAQEYGDQIPKMKDLMLKILGKVKTQLEDMETK